MVHPVGLILERAARAVPAARVADLGGWRLRHDDSAAWWVSTVLAHGNGNPDLPRRIGPVEEFYRYHGAPARFQISPATRPTGLDGVLAERGYRLESPMSLHTAATGEVIGRSPAAPLPVRVDDHPTDAWFLTWSAVHGAVDPGPELRMLERVDQPSCYVAVLAGGRAVAVGRAVAETGWAGVFGMATLPHARGRGAARSVLAALARWAGNLGAARMYLQVEPDNTAARRLYGSAGFSELCRYHYRTSG
jgi:N-acetylglutamate synthase